MWMWVWVLAAIVTAVVGFSARSSDRENRSHEPTDGCVDPEAVVRGQKLRWLGLLFLTALPFLIAVGIWGAVHGHQGRLFYPFYACTVLAAACYGLGERRITQNSKGPIETRDANATSILRRLAAQDVFWSWSRRRTELAALHEELVDAYLEADDALRAELRLFFRGRYSLSLSSATQQIFDQCLDASSTPDEAEVCIRRGTVATAISFEHGSSRLDQGFVYWLRQRAEAAGFDPVPTMKSVAADSYPEFAKHVKGVVR